MASLCGGEDGGQEMKTVGWWLAITFIIVVLEILAFRAIAGG